MSQDVSQLNVMFDGAKRDVLPKVIPGVLGLLLVFLALPRNQQPDVREVLKTLDTAPAIVLSLSLAAIVLAVGSVLELLGSILLFISRWIILVRLREVLQKMLGTPDPLHHDRVMPWYQRLWERLVNPEKQFMCMQVRARQIDPDARHVLPRFATEASIHASLCAVLLAALITLILEAWFGPASALASAPSSMISLLVVMAFLCAIGALFSSTRFVDMTIAYLEVSRAGVVPLIVLE